MAVWWNWHTQRSQKTPLRHTGSTPVSATNLWGCAGIGIQGGLKNRWLSGLVGSSPITPTH